MNISKRIPIIFYNGYERDEAGERSENFTNTRNLIVEIGTA